MLLRWLPIVAASMSVPSRPLTLATRTGRGVRSGVVPELVDGARRNGCAGLGDELAEAVERPRHVVAPVGAAAVSGAGFARQVQTA